MRAGLQGTGQGLKGRADLKRGGGVGGTGAGSVESLHFHNGPVTLRGGHVVRGEAGDRGDASSGLIQRRQQFGPAAQFGVAERSPGAPRDSNTRRAAWPTAAASRGALCSSQQERPAQQVLHDARLQRPQRQLAQARRLRAQRGRTLPSSRRGLLTAGTGTESRIQHAWVGGRRFGPFSLVNGTQAVCRAGSRGRRPRQRSSWSAADGQRWSRASTPGSWVAGGELRVGRRGGCGAALRPTVVPAQLLGCARRAAAMASKVWTTQGAGRAA